MFRILLLGVVLYGLTACDQPTAPTSPASEAGEDAGAGFIAEGPTDAVEFACADGRQVMVRAFMGGVIVSVDGRSYEMPQIFVPDAERAIITNWATWDGSKTRTGTVTLSRSVRGRPS